MSTSVRITIAEYDRMIAEGRFEPAEAHRVELIEGEIRPMSPIGHRHSDEIVELLEEWSYENRPQAPDPGEVAGRREHPRASTRSPNPTSSGPVADPIAAATAGRRPISSCSSRWPTPASLRTAVTKASLYAEAGIADYWIVNLRDECIEVRRDPKAGTYGSVTTFRPGESIPLLAFPAIAFPVSVLFDEENDEPAEAEG